MKTLKKHLFSNTSKRLFFISIFIFSIAAFIFTAFISLDPDFGWHYRMGEVITKGGIPKTDPFSYTMSSFPFVDHEWLTNIFIYQVYSKSGFTWLIVFYTTVAFLALYIALNIEKGTDRLTRKGKLWLLFLAAATFIQYFGVRPQIISWLFLSVLLFVFFRKSVWERWRFFLPVFFMAWANIHGSFGAGVVILGLLVFLKIVRLKKIIWQDVVVGILSLGATFLNPYNIHAWREVLQQITDSSVHWTISEWTPPFFTLNFPFLLFSVLSSFFVIRYRKFYILEEKGLFLALLFQAMGATRHVPLWTIFAVPIMLKSFSFLYEEVKKVPFGEKRILAVLKYGLGFLILLFIFQTLFSISSASKLRDDAFYPNKAIEYLRSHPHEGKLFSEYGWGGYLDWKLPEEKVFVDGRMATWKWKENPPEEEGYVFGVYADLLKGNIDYKSVFQKYNITVVIWPQPRQREPFSYLENLLGNRLNFINDLLGIKYKDFELIGQLEKDGWVKVYEDEISFIYQKQN